MSPEPAENSPRPEPAVIPAKTQLLEELTSLARNQPAEFQTLIQHFWPSESVPIEIPPGLIEKSIEQDAEASRRSHRLRVQLLWSSILVIAMVLTFAFGIVWLMRDHVEFTEKVLAALGLLATHGAVGAGAYQVGKRGSRSRSRRP